MATNTAGSTARQLYTQQVHYLTKAITVSDEDVSLTVGTLPAGAYVTAVKVAVTTAFNNSGNDYIKVGHAGDDDEFADDVDVATAGVKLPTTLATASEVTFAVDTPVIAMYEGSSTADGSPAGAALIIVEYVVP